MIVRDEAETLERCLSSVRGVVDEICIADTGSTDDTVAIARRAGARVEFEPWRDDFSRARNASLAMATGDWALVLDADDVLDLPAGGANSARARLIDFANRGTRRLGQLVERNLDGDRELSKVAITRYFPLRAGLEFRGPVHEQVASTREAIAEWRRELTGLSITHTGYAQATIDSKRKLERNLTLLERWTRDEPNDAYAWYQFGRTLNAAGRHAEAIDALRTALEQCDDRESWPVHAVELAGQSLRAIGRVEQALTLVAQACEWTPDRADTLFLRSSLELDLGAVDDARAGFERCLELPHDLTSIDSWIGARGFAAAHNLGVIAECTGRADEARKWYERALGFEPSHEPSRAGLARLSAARSGLPSRLGSR